MKEVKPNVPEMRSPSADLEDVFEFSNLNTSVEYGNMIQDALYFFPNPSNTSFNEIPIPTPNNYVIPEAFSERACAIKGIISHRSCPKELFETWSDEYRYYYKEEFKKVIVDQAVSAMTTNIMGILYNGVFAFLRAMSPEYVYRYVFDISHYDLQRIILDFMDTNTILDGSSSHPEFDHCTVLTVLCSELEREIAYRVSDYLRMVLADPKFNLGLFVKRAYERQVSEIFNSMDKESITALMQSNCATNYMFAYGILQDYINIDLLRIQEILEINLNYLFHELLKFNNMS